MYTQFKEVAVQSNYALKNSKKDLIQNSLTHHQISLSTLEEIRTSKKGISASKFGLEVICGASCETGAM
jgi:hypothetical protein